MAVATLTAAPFVWPEPVASVPASESSPSGNRYSTVGALTGSFVNGWDADETVRYLANNVAVDRLAIREFALWCIEVFDRYPKAG